MFNLRDRNKILFFLLLIFWFLLNLIQSDFTEITFDEAYYWLFGKNLAWGYFDHPPMIALLVRIGSSIFKSNIGVRLMVVLLQLFTLYLIWMTIDHKNAGKSEVLSFFLIASSIVVFSVFGFIATPDAPLLFFTALFLFSYRKFLINEKWSDVFLLAISMSGLIYSKYQSIIMLTLVLLSNISLLKSFKFWTAIAIAIVLLLPHLVWQVSNGYPGIKYQLIDRAQGFSLRNIIEYLPEQFAIFNPFVLGSAIYIMVKERTEDSFKRALYYIITGVIAFFGLSAFRGHVEAHWTALCSIPLIILISKRLPIDIGLKKFLIRTLVPSLIIIMSARFLVITDLKMVRSMNLNGKKDRFEFIASIAKDRPVVFLGSYPYPAMYSYFTGKDAMAINSFASRLTQYDIWQPESKYNNKPVFVCGFGEGDSRLYKKGDIEFYGYAADSLQTVNRINVSFEPRPEVITVGDTLQFTLQISNPYNYDIDFGHRRFPVSVYSGFLKNKYRDYFPFDLSADVGVIKAGETIIRKAVLIVPEMEPGWYKFGVCLLTLTGPAINNSFTKVRVESKK
jgi:hypothetical protein